MQHVPRSPYARALGSRLDELHPRLRSYFSPLPEGCIGVGEGVFRRVGTPRRWLWRFLKPLHDRGVVYAGWQMAVPFRITNRLVSTRLVGERDFLIPGQEWRMSDAVSLTPHGRIVDELGEPSIVAASFDVDVDDGALMLTSHRVGVRLGRRRIRVPRALSPVIRLRESFDDASDRQRVAVTIDMPLLGRIYEYSGDFTYRIEEDA
ncbi:DUF4166 domain-containing protein [uncultured Microbacterium sp.]|uniref:DUF4166 domain-containing protein n=1 Tax=uncultured Microbacterium sp. TaxID=191216 RepID=UPI0026052CC4|nr:DUF4166 domain-containing protein [uncultured Microbacterium sp.]